MKDIQKTARALSLIDERFIDEAAEPRLLDVKKRSRAPIFVLVGAACAAALCFTFIKGAPKRSVSLLPAQSEETSDISSAVFTDETGGARQLDLPEVIALPEMTSEQARAVVFGSEYPSVVWADSERAAFTDIRESIYVYDFSSDSVVFCANVKQALDGALKELGSSARFGGDSWNGIGFGSFGGDIGVSLRCQDNSTTYYYTVDLQERCLRRADGSGGFSPYVNLDVDMTELYEHGMSGYCVKMGEGYVAAFLDYTIANNYPSVDLEHIKLQRFTVNNGTAVFTDTRQPCGESFFDGLPAGADGSNAAENSFAEFLLSQDGLDFRKAASRAAMAFLRGDKEGLSKYLADPSYDAGLLEDSGRLEYMVMKFPAADTSSEVYAVTFEYAVEGIDMNMYLDLGLRKTASGRLVEYIYTQG